MEQAARRLWTFIEPYHALIYFAPEAHRAFEDVGLRGFWRGYFAGRASPLGPVGPGVVTACFYGFHPAFVARAVPSIWSMIDPETAVLVRLSGIDGALDRLLGDDRDDPAIAEAAWLIREVVEACSPAGRPLFAANQDLDWPEDPGLALWHAATLLREHRGDGHVAALAVAGVDPCEAHITQVAASGAPLESIQPYRGWTDDDMAAAIERLRSRGWVDGDDRLTPEGRKAREQIELDTDRLATEPVARLGSEATDRLLALLAPIVTRLLATGVIPFPNPIGVPAPR